MIKTTDNPTPKTAFIISGPSGTGKSTLLKRVFQEFSNLRFSVSHTTRRPRPGEVDGRDYYFVTREKFLEMQNNDEFLEWAEVHDFFYGTSKAELERAWTEDFYPILDIDPQGALQVMEKLSSGTYIFITPPTMAEMKSRIESRGTDEPGAIATRISNARKELEQIEKYDYLLINDDLDKCAADLAAVIRAALLKPQISNFNLDEFNGGDSK